MGQVRLIEAGQAVLTFVTGDIGLHRDPVADVHAVLPFSGRSEPVDIADDLMPENLREGGEPVAPTVEEPVASADGNHLDPQQEIPVAGLGNRELLFYKFAGFLQHHRITFFHAVSPF